MGQIIGLTGFAQTGKDTAAQILVEKHGFTRIGFADAVREMLLALNPAIGAYRDDLSPYRLSEAVDEFGWDEAKVTFSEVRELLQRMGTEAGRRVLGDNVWIDTAVKKASALEKVVFSDVRFQNEVQAIRNAGGFVFRVVRNGVEAVNSHISDAGVASLVVDALIYNNGSVEDLEEVVSRAVNNFESRLRRYSFARA